MKITKYSLLLLCLVFLSFAQMSKKVSAEDGNTNKNSSNQNKNNSLNPSTKIPDSNQNTLEQISNSNSENSNANSALDKEKSERKMELSFKELVSVKMEGFDTWVYYFLLSLFIIFVIASLYFIPKAVDNSSLSGTFILFLACAVIMFFVGKACDRRYTSVESEQKIKNVEETVENKIPPSPPLPPSGLSTSPVSDSQIKLSWDDNDITENGFEIERSIGSDGKFVPLAKVGPNATTYTDSGLGAETTAYYRIRSYKVQNGKNLQSDFSDKSSSTTTKLNNQDTWSNPKIVSLYVFVPIIYGVLLLFLSLKFFNKKSKKEYLEEERMYLEMVKMKEEMNRFSRRQRIKSSKL